MATKYRNIHDDHYGQTGLSNQGQPLDSFVAYDSVPTSKETFKCVMLLKRTKTFEAWNHPREEGSFEGFLSLFTDHFYFFLRDNHYYFVTMSGKLYHVPPPVKKGEFRVMKELWQGEGFPIAAVLEDADNDKVWLFTKSRKKDVTKGVYFEMAPTIRTVEFDHAKLAPVNVEGRAKALLEYLPLVIPKAKK